MSSFLPLTFIGSKYLVGISEFIAVVYPITISSPTSLVELSNLAAKLTAPYLVLFSRLFELLWFRVLLNL